MHKYKELREAAEAAETSVEAKDTAIVAGAETIYNLKAENATLRSQLAEAREALVEFAKMFDPDKPIPGVPQVAVNVARRAADIGGKDDG